MIGTEGKKKMITVIIATAVLTAGAVVAAVMTGIIPHTSSATPPQASAASETPPAPVHKRTVAKARVPVSRVASTAMPPPPPCTDCGVVESIESYTEKGPASGGGAVAGGLLGGILGHQVGQGRGKDLATVAGVVGGALAGNTIEKNANKVTRFHVGVRMNDGTRELLTLNTTPSVAVGDHVRIVNGEPVRD